MIFKEIMDKLEEVAKELQEIKTELAELKTELVLTKALLKQKTDDEKFSEYRTVNGLYGNKKKTVMNDIL